MTPAQAGREARVTSPTLLSAGVKGDQNFKNIQTIESTVYI